MPIVFIGTSPTIFRSQDFDIVYIIKLNKSQTQSSVYLVN